MMSISSNVQIRSEKECELCSLCEKLAKIDDASRRSVCGVLFDASLCWIMSHLSCSILAIFFILILNHLIRLPSPVARTRSRRHTTRKTFFFLCRSPSSPFWHQFPFFPLLIRVSPLALSEKHFQLRCQFFDLTIRSFLRSLSPPTLLCFVGTQAKWCFSCHDLSSTYFHTFFCQIFLTSFRYCEFHQIKISLRHCGWVWVGFVTEERNCHVSELLSGFFCCLTVVENFKLSTCHRIEFSNYFI